MAEQLWKGRFSQAVDSRVNDFNSSIRFDQRMARQDITGSMANAAMLGAQGIIPESDTEAILKGLEGILADLESGVLAIDPEAEDIHTFVEQTLTARIGDAGKRLHTGRSRNDQVALDIRLTLRDMAHGLEEQLADLIDTLTAKAEEYAGAVMPGYTHLQRAQPITFGHHLMAYVWMLLRDLDRFEDAVARMDAQCPLGSGALAGTTYPLDRRRTAEALGFAAPCQNSLDGVSDRDFCIELASAMSICMMHLSRLSEEIILWSSWEFKFIELDDAFTTGSSIMPQKKNPDVTELIRGKTGRVYGDLNTLLVMMKGLPLAYNKDMQEDKEAIFDAVDTLALCLRTVTPMLATMRALPENMRAAAAKGFINATDCADYLTKKGMPFRDAYKLTGSLVAWCIGHNTVLEALTLEQFREFSPVFDEGIFDAIDLVNCTEGRISEGGPCAASVHRQVEQAAAQLAQWKEKHHG
ncbi:MAG: argininosuccinate lyase [Oscillospiraceae bacterium]|nr:argininosuccinate lyase [Oscillospiraceae bacterium]